MEQAPHPIPYQGSKRRLAQAILRFAPARSDRWLEPFAGSAALTIAAARRDLARGYVIGERLEPLAALWSAILATPERVADLYEGLWTEQHADPASHFNAVRTRFNAEHDPVLLLYLLARCVKNAVRFNPRGEFNQSADHRRRGMRPQTMRVQILRAAQLLAGSTAVLASDYRELLAQATPRDLVYMDPPYQGVSGRDKRYVAQLDLEAFTAELHGLNQRDVPYLLSFDGSCGDVQYGRPLPESLGLSRVAIDAGRSSQATLAGRSARTVESLYVSPALRRSA